MRRFFLLALALFGLPAVTFGRPAYHPGDAAVRCVQFVDEREGWAVGDDGVIWHSIDGGQSWERQDSGVNASLRTVHFLTPYTGWVVGRVELPGGDSRGVVLATTDGGLKWTQVAHTALPGLNAVRFFNQRNGIAAGDGTDRYPSGVFTTSDGGVTWKPIPGKRCPSWLTADFVDADTGALGGPWSHLATVRDGMIGAADVDPVGGRSIKSLKLSGPFGVAVGQGGLILVSSKSAGLKWGFAVPNLPKEVLAACDFNAAAIRGDHVWVAGRPGTFVLHSPDRGHSWEMQKTGQPLALHTIFFLNENLGWAAGEYGTLLVTEDGGKNWKVARQGAQRSAALFVHAGAGQVPFETIAMLGEDDGYLTTALRVASPAAPSQPDRHPDDERAATRKLEATGAHPRLALDLEKLQAAMRHVGGGSGESLWQFPLPPQEHGLGAKELLACWEKLHGDRADREVLRQIVLAIRIWRPEVVITDGVVMANKLETLVAEATKEAFKLASDPQAFPEQLASLKLEAWAPKKLYGGLSKVEPTAVKVPIDEVMTRLGDSLRDYAQPAAAFLTPTPEPVEHRAYQLLATRLADQADAGLMQGVALAYGGQARRSLPPVEDEVIKARPAIEKAVGKRRILENLARGVAGDLGKPEQALAHIVPAVKEMPGDFGARAAFAIAQQYERSGQWVFAREAYLIVVDRFPKHPLALEAARWLIRYQASSEARRRQELGHFAIVTETAVVTNDPKTQSGPIKGGTDIVQTSHVEPINDGEDTREWFKGSLAIESRLANLGAMYADDPAMQLCLMSARRQLGDHDSPKKWFSRYLSETAVPLGGQTVVRGADAYRDCAMAELWLSNRTVGVNPPKPIAYSARTERRPHLDGKLDDDCWQSARPLVLTTVAGDLDTAARKEGNKLNPEYTTRAWFASDAEYLYIAIEATHPAGQRVRPMEKRSRDMDLNAFDRVDILLDLDRDYQTYFHLQIDQRGCLAEDCWGDKRWNPQWFVAVQSEETTWTAEAAIPLKELTSNPPAPGTTWAANVTRIVPTKGLQAWSIPADATPRPEGMGLLQFIQAPK